MSGCSTTSCSTPEQPAPGFVWSRSVLPPVWFASVPVSCCSYSSERASVQGAGHQLRSLPSPGSSWGESSSGRITNWLVLKNLTPQVRPEHVAGGWHSAGRDSSSRPLLEPEPFLRPASVPQIDGSTLRTLCMQHGPLITFHLNLPHGNALVRYSSKEEVVKAQKSLHM